MEVTKEDNHLETEYWYLAVWQFLAKNKKTILPAVFLFLVLGGSLGTAFFLNGKSGEKIVIEKNNEATSSSMKKEIVVDIAGAVVRPGVHRLPPETRIGEAISSAGGFSSSADTKWVEENLNLAAKLPDGGKIYIPKIGENYKSQTTGKTIGKNINVNSVSSSELESLSGVGPATAEKIISGRPYQTIEELLTRKILNRSVFEKIKEKIAVY